MYEVFEHTADLGLRIRAPDLDTLFAEAAQALFATLVEDLGSIANRESVHLHLQATDHAYLLFDWLNELLYRFETQHLLFGKFEVHVHDGKLEGTAWGEPLDRSRHAMDHEVKAITYHGLKVERTPDGWLAEVIVDI